MKNYQDHLENFAVKLNAAKSIREFNQIKSEINRVGNENIKRDIAFILDVNLNRLKFERERRKNIL